LFTIANNCFLQAVIIKFQDTVHYIIYGVSLSSFKCTGHNVHLRGKLVKYVLLCLEEVCLALLYGQLPQIPLCMAKSLKASFQQTIQKLFSLLETEVMNSFQTSALLA